MNSAPNLMELKDLFIELNGEDPTQGSTPRLLARVYEAVEWWKVIIGGFNMSNAKKDAGALNRQGWRSSRTWMFMSRRGS